MNHARSTHFQKVQQKRYAERSFRNPYFHTKDPSRWRLIALLVLFFASLGGGAWFLLTAPMFTIRDIRIEGNETIALETLATTVQSELDRRVLWVFRRSNQFLFDPARVKAALNAPFSFDNVIIDQQGTKLDVHVRERQSQLLWRSGEAVFLVDNAGKVIRPLTDEERGGLTLPDPPPGPGQTLSPMARLKRLRVFVDINKAPVAPGDAVLTPEEAAGALSFEQHLLDQALPFTELRVDRLAGTWMAVKMLAGYDILFDPLGNVDAEAVRLATLFRDTVKTVHELSYVDLRFGDHVYYK